MITETSTRRSKRGGRRVLAGEGMVTPVRPLVSGDGETLTPGRTRLALSHPLVRQQPEVFTLCCRGDRTNAPREFRAMLKRAERELSEQLPEPWRLGSSPSSAREAWRLP